LIFIKFFNVSIQNNAQKHIYSILLFFGNLALITSGTTIELVNASFNDWSLAVSYMLYIIIALTTVGLFFCTKLHPAKISFFLEEKKSTYGGPNINRLSICIFILVFSYAALLPITDILWKKNLSLCFKGDPAKYSSFIAMATKYTGISLMILSIFLKPFFLRMRWKQLALLTPITYITLFIPIFLLIEIDNLHVFSAFKDLYLMTSYLGAFQASIFYSLKYIVVAVVKSMSTLKLKKTPHVRSKLFIDIINYKFGNAFSAWVIIFLFSMCKTMELQNIYPYLFLYIIFLLAMWIWTICYLEKHYQKP
jgi:ATP/ADP translocase